MSDKSEISYPIAKASAALASSGATSAYSLLNQPANTFLPHDLAGWLACAASTAALTYSLHLLWDYYWRKVWRPICESYGLLRPKPHKVVIVDDEVVVE
jgi:hypothetical protein